MTRGTISFITRAVLMLSGGLVLAGCLRGSAKEDAKEESTAPPDAVVLQEETDIARVDHPEQFPLALAEQHEARPALSVTGVVANDVSRSVPVWSLVSGRVVDLDVRLGDTVDQGQRLARIRSTEISDAFSTYRHAVTDEALARTQLDRAKALFERGAIPKKDLEVAQDAADKAAVDVETAAENLRVLGIDPDHAPTATIGFMRFGMFVTAIFHGQSMEMRTAVPASAILHMHDRDWVYVPETGNRFRRVEVVSGDTLPGEKQELRSGIRPGQQVVSNALVLDRAIEQ